MMLEPRPLVAPRRARVALVVGAGGMKCVAAIGMWKVLCRAGIDVDLAVGCSGGSVYTALIAMGMPVAEIERCTTYMWEGLFKRPHYRSLLRVMLPRRFGFNERLGLISDRAIGTVFRELFGEATFADARIPLYLAATDVYTGERCDIHEGRLRDAVRASVAVPLLLRPWPVDGRLLMDGGTSDPLPISVAIREGADIILGMGFETPISTQLDSLAKVAGQAISITTNHLIRATYAFYSSAHHAEIIPLMPEFDRPVGFGDTQLIPYLIEQGERVTEAQLPYLERLMTGRALRSVTGP